MSRSLTWLAAFGLALPSMACSSGKKTPVVDGGPSHSGTMALSADGTQLFVVNPDSDSVSQVDLPGQKLIAELPLGSGPPTVDADGGFTPAVYPRSVALDPAGHFLYAVGERSGMLHALPLAKGSTGFTVPLCSEPVSVVLSLDGTSAYVTCSQDASVVKVDLAQKKVVGTVATTPKPWSLALLSDGTLLATHLLTGAVTSIDSSTMTLKDEWAVPDTGPRTSAQSAPLPEPRLAHGKVRGEYAITPRPGTDELWVAHVLLGVDTPQPPLGNLDFENTVFPAISVLHQTGVMETRLSINAQDVPGINGAFADIVSGPHQVVFTQDGAFALMVDTNSEDVMVVDANARLEASLLRPLPGHMPEGIVLSADEQHAYVDERNTGDILVLDVDRSDGGVNLSIAGDPIGRWMQDPMPSQMRLGQHLFYSANSDEYPVTKNHWVSCSTCHLEGRSDAVTWRFAQGPRDTPSNAGGVLSTGFLFRTADRREVQDYWRTIYIEQGGDFTGTDPAQQPLLDAIADYVNHGIPFPIPPTTNASQVARGQVIFNTTGGCIVCHSGPFFTDSADGNPGLDLDAGACSSAGGTPCVVLHNVGTCVVGFADGGGPYADVAHPDIDGDVRDGCSYDTPTLRGIGDSAPYLHDGRAATIEEVFQMAPQMGNTSTLSSDDLAALAEYVRSL